MGLGNIDSGRHPLLFSIAQRARWAGTDAYPAFPECADEHERWLEFIRARSAWDYYVARLRGSAARRGEELAEIAVAYFLSEVCGLPILEWQPPGAPGRRGDFLTGILPCGQMFTEVKSPGWEAEIAREQGQASPRLLLPKYVNGEGRWGDPAGRVRETVARAYSQFPDTMPTLLILNDDLQVPLNDSLVFVKAALYAKRFGDYTTGYLATDGSFVGRQCERLGAVGLLTVEFPIGAARPEFRFSLFRNPNAQGGVGVPRSIFAEYATLEGPDN